MALSDPRIVYGVHSIAAINRSTGDAYGIAKVLANSSFAINGELVTLNGGSQKYPWAIEEGNVTAEITLQVRQIEDWMFEVFLGKAPTADSSGSSTGSVSTPVAKTGSIIDATTGVASIAELTGSESDMKFGTYLIKAASPTTVDIYVYSDVDFNRGTDKTYENDLLKVTASPLTVPGTDGTVSVPGFGLEITGGSGTVAMTTGDSAEFQVLPPYTKSSTVTIGGGSDVFPEFKAVMMASQRGNQEMFEIVAHRVKGAGLPLGLTEKAFAEPEITAQAFYDSTKNGIADITWVKPE